MDLDEIWNDDPEPVQAEIVPTPQSILLRRDDTQGKIEAMRRIEDQILESAMGTIQAALRFAEINPADDDPPKAWVEELGEEAARAAHRVARYATMSRKDAPAGLEIARTVMLGIVKARATEKQPRELQVNVVQVQVTDPTIYAVKDITDSL